MRVKAINAAHMIEKSFMKTMREYLARLSPRDRRSPRTRGNAEGLGVLIFVGFSILCFLVIGTSCYSNGYKRGVSDCIKNKVTIITITNSKGQPEEILTYTTPKE